MKRRDFIQLCTAAAAFAATDGVLLARPDAAPRYYSRVRLVRADGVALKASALAVGRNYVFHYPFASTPCFLLNLGRAAGRPVGLETENGESYTWPGGVGPERAIVGYSAICAHRMAHPTRQVSFISYRREPYRLQNGNGTPGEVVANVIVCCAEGSVYDPASGAAVLAGPAKQPLAAILLEHEAASDELIAVGTYGGEMFNQFFETFALRLGIEYGAVERAQKGVDGVTEVFELEAFSGNTISC
jgi:arsenite oxidase small subunit